MPTSIEDTASLFLSDCSLTAGCEGTPQNTPDNDFRWDFYVGSEGDIENPYITTTYPQSSDLANPATTSRYPIIAVEFSENVDATTVFQTDINNINRPLPGNFYLQKIETNGNLAQVPNDRLIVDFHGSWFTVHLNPGDLLDGFSSYQVIVQDVEDLCGNVINPNNYTWQFTTNDQVPGVAGWYPVGDNVCPDTLISITFNTSMYYDQVEMTITDGFTFWNYILPPAETGITSVNDANGEFRIVDVDPTNISNNYRVFEFISTSA